MEEGKAAHIAIIVAVLFVVLVIILPILTCPCFRQVDRQADNQQSIYNQQQRRSRPTGASREPKSDDWDSDVELGLKLTTANLLLWS
jgi:hypothetical protein